MNIPDRWIAKLDSLPPKDFKTLVMAILKDESEPEITEKLQFVASDIYADIKQLQQTSERVRKSRSKRYSNVTVTVTETLQKHNSNGYSNVTETKEERKEGVPPCPPLPLPPTPPITNPPIIPPYQEKREEVTDSAGAGACENEQIPFEGFEPLDPPESEVKRRKPTIAERFEALWAEYPKKNGKKNAFESYQRALKDGVTDEVIADGIKRYKEHIATKHTEDKYILIGSSYFQQRRWEDEYDTNTADGKDENGKPAWMSQEDWEEMNAVFG